MTDTQTMHVSNDLLREFTHLDTLISEVNALGEAAYEAGNTNKQLKLEVVSQHLDKAKRQIVEAIHMINALGETQ